MCNAYPEGAAFQLKGRDYQKEKSCHNSGFDTEGLQCAVLARPWDLEVCDGEASQGTEKVDESGNLALAHISPRRKE